MARFSIDLLPLEFKAESLKRAKFYKVQNISVLTILVVVFLSSLTVALRFLQSQKISQINNVLAQSQSRVSSLKDTEVQVTVLKNRLTTIDKYLGVTSLQVQMYSLIQKLLPGPISLSSLAVNNNREILLQANTLDEGAIDELINNLTDQDKISTVSLDNLNRGRDGIYRFSLTIKPKQK